MISNELLKYKYTMGFNKINEINSSPKNITSSRLKSPQS